MARTATAAVIHWPRSAFRAHAPQDPDGDVSPAHRIEEPDVVLVAPAGVLAQMAMISADPAVMHGQAVIAGTRVPVSVILDCIASGMTTEQITAEYPTVTAAGAAAAYGAALAREELLPILQSR